MDDTTCALPSGGVRCAVSVAINPFVWATEPTGGWKSSTLTGPSDTIVIDFSGAIRRFTVSVYDADYADNDVVALDSAGNEIDRESAPSDGAPGVPTTSLVTVSGSLIRRIMLIPGPDDYVVYVGASFVRKCAVVSDSVLNSELIKAALEAALDSSLSLSPIIELKGVIFRNYVTNKLRFELIVPNWANSCEINVDYPPTGDYEYFVGGFHTHPFPANFFVVCPDPTKSGRVNHERWGGGSERDWATVNQIAVQHAQWVEYTIDVTRKISRLNPNVPARNYGSNPNRWTIDSVGCYSVSN